MKNLKFPIGFLWGSATSSYQVEGGIENCDWSKDFPAGTACDHYNRYEEDFDLLKKFNQNAHRFSIEWSRIEPEEGKFDEKEIEHYRDVILSLKEREIEPFVTLWHFTTPLWLDKLGGVESKKFPHCFANFTERVVKEYKDLVKFWMTINEPQVYTAAAYLSDLWPPQKNSVVAGIKVYKNLITSHQKAYKTIRRISPGALIGIANNSGFCESFSSSFLDKFIVSINRYLRNDYFLNKIKDYQDFIGLNYYSHELLKFTPNLRGSVGPFVENKNKNRLVSDVGTEIYPEGIYHVLLELKKYRKPIYITENGLADAEDSRRRDFIRDHLFWIHRAINAGVDVRGYFYWSILDNFEWEKGFDPRFGLVEVDYQTLKRKPRPSAFYYTDIAKKNQLIIND